MRLRAAAPLLALTIALGLGGCGTEADDPAGGTGTETTSEAGDDSTATDDAPTTEEPTMTPTPTDPADPTGGTALPTGPVSDEIIARDNVQAAIADLAEREGVDAGQVSVAGFTAVTWNDGSIGCPEPGMMYTQALVPGHMLVLELDGQFFSYHSADRGSQEGVFNYCANPKIPTNLGQDGPGATM
ncbi:hypothetical protein MWU75_11450 [Ornithinimicrobium sp. F0845]|uniref:hypothetical protein n=1 Tax=Ornithinimicrobium sp. F0845 TaxID=2926412 RepID=UPI001FF52714|nr:hypothetical protein [Ornithinimicrobium sp. F0845]MCK0112755.1 hypothetical protein [Ornithinimicrobium sp. F0845]